MCFLCLLSKELEDLILFHRIVTQFHISDALFRTLQSFFKRLGVKLSSKFCLNHLVAHLSAVKVQKVDIHEEEVCSWVILVNADTVEEVMLMGTVGATGHISCLWCDFPGWKKPGMRMYYLACRSTSCGSARRHWSLEEALEVINNPLAANTMRNASQLKTGISHWPPLFKLPLFPNLYPFNFTLELLHLDYQNITKDIINCLRPAAPAPCGKQLSTVVLTAMSAAQEASQPFIPTGVAEHLPPLKEKVGTYKGDQWQTLIGISIPPSLFGITFAIPEVADVLIVLSKYTSLKERTCFFLKMVTPSIDRLPHSLTFIRLFGLPKQMLTWGLENYTAPILPRSTLSPLYSTEHLQLPQTLLLTPANHNYLPSALKSTLLQTFAASQGDRSAWREHAPVAQFGEAVLANGDVLSSKFVDGTEFLRDEEEEGAWRKAHGRKLDKSRRAVRITNYNKTTLYSEVLNFLSIHLSHNGRPEAAPRLVASPLSSRLIVLHQMCPSFLRSTPHSSTVISIEQIQMGMGLHFCAPEDGKLNQVALVVHPSMRGTVWLGQVDWKL
ncbi:hypothetical protein JCM5296_004021 [Sporobolomyces johnsonii]